MMHKKILAGIIVVIVIAAALAVGWQLTQNAAEKRTIKMGLVAPISSSSIGQDMNRAAMLAVKQINAAGGIRVDDWGTNATIELITADTVDDSPSNAVPAVDRIVTSEKVDLLIGGYSSAGTLADQVTPIKQHVPFIITGASTNLVTRRGPQGDYGGLPANDTRRIEGEDAAGMEYMFHYCTTTYDYSKTVVDFFATEMKPLLESTYNFSSTRPFRLAILYRNDAFGQGVFAASKYWIQQENLPIELVATAYWTAGTTDFHEYLLTAKTAQPDAVFVVENPDKTPLVITQGINDVGLKTVYIAVENNEDPAFYSGLKETGQSQLLESKFSPYAGAYLPLVVPYVTAYKEEYDGTVPGMMGADTYDAVYIAKAAIENAGTVDKTAVKNALQNLSLDPMLILTESCKIEFNSGTNYHEIGPITFIEQLEYDSALGECRPQIVWTPPNAPTLTSIRQANFTLPENYEPSSS